MSNLRIWKSVPTDSQLELLVVAPSGEVRNFVARARVVDRIGNEEIVEDDDLRGPEPAVIDLAPKGAYVVRVVASFGGNESSGEVRGVVRKPNGDSYGDPFVYPFDHTIGDPVRATLVVVMEGA